MNTKMQFEAMERALPYAAELVDCKELTEFKKTIQSTEGMTAGQMMKKLLPLLLHTKRDTLFALLGAISGKDARDIETQDWAETKALLESDIITDLFDFFTFSARMVRHV